MKMTLEGKESILGITEDANTVRILLVSEPGMYKLVFKSRKPEAENIIPDISTGILFNKYIKERGYNPEKICKTYTHIYPDGREIPGVRQYPDSLYPLFTEWFQKEWLAKRCVEYIIKKTDVHVLPYLQNTFPNVIEYRENKKLENNK